MARWGSDGTERSELLAGWPMRSLRCVNYGDIDINLGSSRMGMNKSGLNPIEGGIEISSAGGPWRALPYKPLWVGLVVDTLFWGVVALFAASFIANWKKRRRIKHGLCPACGYNLTGAHHDVCPECGSAVLDGAIPA